MNYEQKYKDALDLARIYHGEYIIQGNNGGAEILEDIFSELKDGEDERIRKELIEHIKANYEADYVLFKKFSPDDVIAWLEKRGEINLEHYKDGEKEKHKFVGYGFLKCKGDFLSFKEGETYWLEYVGNDNYNVRSDNLLGQTFHIKPVELYTVFRPTTWLEKQGEKNINHTDIIVKAHQIAWETSKDYDPLLSKEAWCEMAALDMASWLEKQSEQVLPTTNERAQEPTMREKLISAKHRVEYAVTPPCKK